MCGAYPIIPDVVSLEKAYEGMPSRCSRVHDQTCSKCWIERLQHGVPLGSTALQVTWYRQLLGEHLARGAEKADELEECFSEIVTWHVV